MIIQGSVNTDKENLLIKKYTDLIHEGIKSKEILVLVLNPFKKSLFIDALMKYCPELPVRELNIHTIYGLYYNAFTDNINYVKSLLKSTNDEVLNLCGLEISQYIFKNSIKEADFSDYISKVNLLHQLFRRYSLIVQNDLSNEEIIKRSELLGESFYKDAQKAIQDYKIKTIEYKSFDYLRQAAIFPLIYQNTGYFDSIKYLLVDDADELSYISWKFIDFLVPKLSGYMIAYDKDGTSRCGYLCAYKSGISDFKKKYNPKETILIDKSVYTSIAGTLYNNIKQGLRTKLNGIVYKNSIRRLDMLDKVIEETKILIDSGVKANDIAIITPVTDELLEKTIKEKNPDIKFQIISGSEKLSDTKIIKHILTILKITNNIEVNSYEIKSLLINLLKIPFKNSYEIIENYEKGSFLEDINYTNEIYKDRFKKLQSFIISLKKTKYSLTEQIKAIYSNIIKDNILEYDISKYDFMLKEASGFELAFGGNIKDITGEFIIQIENSVISENPANAFSIKKDEVIIASPQKIIDFSLKTKYQLWLDISSSEWFKQDSGTLYNAWVFNRDWNKNEYSLEDNIKLTRDKTARIVRKLMLCAQKEIRLFDSLYDNTGNENFGGLNDYIEAYEIKQKEFKITPREDQKPVLKYKAGKMGVMAVPGAGKTTILLALIVKLINSGVSPRNIFVLTYMESAAKNFKERIKQSIPSSSELPNISTIHGLALRIIKENGNYTKAGLDEDFEVCDDNTKERILKEISFKLKIPDDKYENYLKSISVVKLSQFNRELKSKYPDIQEFYNFLNEYNTELKKRNLIDYDDMLRFAVQILQNDTQAAEYYQDLCRYIVEDEAQDSTEIQQILINLLAKKHKNIVRCGDINQSITSTFTNSNLKSFKDFIKQNNKVEMNTSQRCASPIYMLANEMIQASSLQEDKKHAFYPIQIKGTEKNPQIIIEPEFVIFEKENEEKEFILNKIKEIQKHNANASIAILLRLNSQVNDYNEFLVSNEIKTTIRTDCLSQKEIYKFIYAVLNIIENPTNNKAISTLADLYTNNKTKNEKDYIKTFINNTKIPFIKINPDEIENETLMQLYWDIDYWLNNADYPIESIALKAGLYYSKTAADKSNTYIISTFIKRLKTNNETEREILKKIEYYAQRPMSTYKFFEDEADKDEPGINIMTMHKSKGDEFDFVFIPQLNEDNYPLEKGNVKLKSGGHFVRTIKNAMQNCGINSPDEDKIEQTQETLRLLYVGITRAKKGLILSSANHYRIRKNTIQNLFLRDIIK